MEGFRSFKVQGVALQGLGIVGAEPSNPQLLNLWTRRVTLHPKPTETLNPKPYRPQEGLLRFVDMFKIANRNGEGTYSRHERVHPGFFGAVLG